MPVSCVPKLNMLTFAAGARCEFSHACQTPAWRGRTECRGSVVMPVMLHRDSPAAASESRTIRWYKLLIWREARDVTVDMAPSHGAGGIVCIRFEQRWITLTAQRHVRCRHGTGKEYKRLLYTFLLREQSSFKVKYDIYKNKTAARNYGLRAKESWRPAPCLGSCVGLINTVQHGHLLKLRLSASLKYASENLSGDRNRPRVNRSLINR